MPLNNFGLVARKGENCLYRAAQPNNCDLILLDTLNIKNIIKLNKPDNENNYNFYPIEIHNWSLPPLFRFGYTEQIVRCCAQINNLLDRGSLLINCSHGRDRTGLVCAAYKIIYHNATFAEVNIDREQFGVNPLIGLFDYPDKLILRDIVNERN